MKRQQACSKHVLCLDMSNVRTWRMRCCTVPQEPGGHSTDTAATLPQAWHASPLATQPTHLAGHHVGELGAAHIVHQRQVLDVAHARRLRALQVRQQADGLLIRHHSPVARSEGLKERRSEGSAC